MKSQQIEYGPEDTGRRFNKPPKYPSSQGDIPWHTQRAVPLSDRATWNERPSKRAQLASPKNPHNTNCIKLKHHILFQVYTGAPSAK